MSRCNEGQRSAGIIIKGGSDVRISRNIVQGFDDGIVVESTIRIAADGNVIIGKNEYSAPTELLNAAVRLIEAQHKKTGQVPSEATAEEAAQKAGLSKWFTDQSINIANLGAALLSLYLNN